MINEQILGSTRRIARELARHLEDKKLNIVIAESCTAGLASAILGEIPGISGYLCGSVVTYQNGTKESWLQIDPDTIKTHTAVSPEVTTDMAKSVLQKTPQADFSVAITGHLERIATTEGPRVFVTVAWRRPDGETCSQPRCFLLHQKTRVSRQWEAARCALHLALEHLRFPPVADQCHVDWAKICLEPVNYRWNHWY